MEVCKIRRAFQCLVSFAILKSETANHANVWWAQSGPDSANLALEGAAEFTKEQSLLQKVPAKVDLFEKMQGSSTLIR